ncbi:hypothetical protein, partial [Isoptericola croceus]|uniref:hypothetical protein n=1 Tax=Isoptericola croceus TaxID=3031406 RepID=UPI0023F929DD
MAAVSSEVIDINQAFDEGVAKINNYLREHRRTVLHVPKGALSANVTFFGSEVVGLDSWKRTGNCTLEVVDKNVTLEYHWGLGLFQ